MPTVYVTVSENIEFNAELAGPTIRQAVARGLDSRSRRLDETHISLRVQQSSKSLMLGDLELEIFGQFFVRRWRSRDRRAYEIANEVARRLEVECACWINLATVGYSRVTTSGEVFFSD